MLWLPLLFAFEDGLLQLRGLAAKATGGVLGAAGAFLLLMALDGLILDDFLFSVRPSNFRAVTEFNLAEEPQQEREGRHEHRSPEKHPRSRSFEDRVRLAYGEDALDDEHTPCRHGECAQHAIRQDPHRR